MNTNTEYIIYYSRKIATYKDRLKWLRKQIKNLNDKIAIYEECKTDFMKPSAITKNKKRAIKEDNNTDDKATDTKDKTKDE